VILFLGCKRSFKKLENGSVDDAKAVCEPDVLKQLARWHVCEFRTYVDPVLIFMWIPSIFLVNFLEV
jgi:hypothetical protein